MTKSLEMMILSLFYITFVNVMFFSKKRIKSAELDAFSRMILFALLGQIFEIGCMVTIMKLGPDSIFSILVNRTYLVILATFQMLFCNFQLIVTISDEQHKKHRKAIMIVNVVAAIIYDGDRVFATQRGYGEYKDWWEFPGGKVESGEMPEEALVREIHEELAAGITVEKFLTTVEYDYPGFHLSMDCFWCEIASGDLVLKEHEAAKWLTKDQLDSVDWLPADVTLINQIREEIQM